MLAEFAAIDPSPRDVEASGREPRRQLNNAFGGPFGVISVDQQHQIPRPRSGEMLERGDLIVMHLDEGMGHGASDRDTELESGGQGRLPRKAGNMAGALCEHPGSRPMPPPQYEIDQRPASGSQHHSARLR